MFFLISVALFALGAIIASFIGVVVARLHTGESFLKGRSRCDACATKLTSRQLVPIFSFVAWGARARCCGSRLSLAEPISELLLGALFVLAYATLGLSPALTLFFIALSLLLALVRYDLAHHVLPFPLLAFFVAVAALYGFSRAPAPDVFLHSLRIAMLLGLLLAAIHALSRGRAMGLADAPLAFGLALLVGPAALPGFLFSFWVGAVIGIFILFQRPAGSRMGVEVPFAPFLAAGFLLAHFTQWNPFIFGIRF